MTDVIRKGLELCGVDFPGNTNIPNTDPTLKSHAIGRVPKTGVLMIRTTLACDLTVRVFCEPKQSWDFPGFAVSDFTRTVSNPYVPAQHFFEAPPGAMFHVKSSVGSNPGMHNGDPV